jgi:hypothetical protein
MWLDDHGTVNTCDSKKVPGASAMTLALLWSLTASGTSGFLVSYYVSTIACAEVEKSYGS